MHDPALLFLDERTAGVDPAARRSFWRTIHALARAGTTVIVTTHYMDDAAQCGRVAMLSQGHLIALGTPAEVAAQVGGQSLEDAFLLLQERDEVEANERCKASGRCSARNSSICRTTASRLRSE